MESGTILIIEDEDKLRELLTRILSLEGYRVIQANNIKNAFRQLEKEDIEVILTDVKLTDGNILDQLLKIKNSYPIPEIIVMTAYGTIEDGVNAMRNGAFDYITKGEGEEQIIPAISKAMDKAQLKARVVQLEKKISEKHNLDTIIGNSPLLIESKKLAAKVAPTDMSVLLLGETGTGKEVFAQAIHYSSERRNNNYVAINCSAIPKETIESELFGYKTGAFTGANKDKKGLFEEANNGTIFLDEIGEMNIELQAKLLRVLETQTFIKPGDTKTTKVNVRIISATNRDLIKEGEEGHFRQDLYYRLASFTIQLPPLRERIEDIEDLCNFFILQYSHQVKKKISKIDSGFLQKLKGYSFKGNIRELKNIIERAIILADGDTLTSALLPSEVFLAENNNGKSPYDLTTIEKIYIQKVLHLTKGNKTKSAELLGIGVTTLYRKLEEYKINY
ncbi:MAG: sigma-54-dependent Fis family transcriptional regulator [Sporocytophaga sp.]|nr:sigma-54 dependent transcriptional regulator [Sporocytophaga sp.]MBO9703340.1 sigma-54-dependent Fis family transcriptional regulator [Sporocytophaga sp.]